MFCASFICYVVFMTVLDISFICFLVIMILLWYKVIVTINRIKYKEENIIPDGGDINHGMVIINGNLEHDEQPNINWHSKLL